MKRLLGIGSCGLWLLLPASALATPEEQVARGMRLLQMQGCVTCHSLDGSPSAGPSFAGRYETRVPVRSEVAADPAGSRYGAQHEVLFDEAYLARSVRLPNADLAAGFAPHVMPSFTLTEEQLISVAAALRSLKANAPPARAPLASFVVAALFFGLLAAVYVWRRRRAPKGA